MVIFIQPTSNIYADSEEMSYSQGARVQASTRGSLAQSHNAVITDLAENTLAGKKRKQAEANFNNMSRRILVEIVLKLTKGIKNTCELSTLLFSFKLTSIKCLSIATEVEANYIYDQKVKLKEFDLKTEADAIIFAKKINNFLKRLDLTRFFNVTDIHLEELIKTCPNLETIIVNSTFVTNKGLQTFLSLKNLSSLSLFYCTSITDKGFQNLTVLKQLTFLDITGCIDITEKGLQSIATLTQLKKLSISDCWGVTKEIIQMLVASLFQLTIFDIRNCHEITDTEARSLMDQSEVGLQIIKDTEQFPPRIHLEHIP